MKSMFVVALLASAGVALAQPAVIDGTRDAAYPTTLGTAPNYPWAQNVQTSFGDNQSEIDNLSAMSTATAVQLFIGGNLQANANRLEIFFDNRSGGGTSNVSGVTSNGTNNVTMDAGFQATHYLSLNRDSGGTTYVDSRTWTGSAWTGNQYLGFSSGGSWSPDGGGVAGFSFVYNGSNTAGVTGGAGGASTATSNAVSTGFEFSIPLSWLGVTFTTPVRVAGFVTNGNRDFLSNQFIGGLATPQDHVGGGAVNLNNIGGTQWVQIPTPGAAALLGLGGVLAMGRRRK